MMDDAERERAEHDLERDDAFRFAVMQVAERMHLFDVPGAGAQDEWQAVAAKLAELPQMRTLPVREALLAPAVAVPASSASVGPRRLWVAVAMAALVVAAFVAGRWSAGW
jgi:hypothetical protein